MIQNLVQYARSEGLTAEPGFAPKVVRWAAVFHPDGRFLQIVEMGDLGNKKNLGATFRKCPELLQPEMKRGGAGCRPFLVDSTDVVALLADDPEDPKLQAKHAYFTRLLRQAAEVLPELAGAAASLEDPAVLAEIRSQLESRKARPTERMTIAFHDETGSRYPVESEAWHDWWRQFRRGLGGGDEKPSSPESEETAGLRALCLVSGELVEPVPTHPKIAGLSDVGGLAMGDALVSFKQDSFRSYGFEQSANAAMSEAIASEYRAALNDLIRNHSRKLAGARVVPWFKERVSPEDDLFAILFEGDPEYAQRDALQRAHQLLEAFHKGEHPDLAHNHYYSLTLSGAAGRVMVRDWMEGEFPDLAASVHAWFEDLSIVRRDGDGLAPSPKLMAVIGGLARQLDDVPQPLQAQLWRSAVRKEVPIPRQAMAQALQRFKLDAIQNETFHHARVGLIKAFLVRQGDHPMGAHLDENHPHPAYHCGRLMAMYAALQYRALGDVGAGVVQRYFASAITTPALVLGRLARGAQFHLDKLERPLARWHEGRIADVWGKIQSGRVPTTLKLEEQSLFALGYYQQIAQDRQKTQNPESSDSTPVTDTQETDHV